MNSVLLALKRHPILFLYYFVLILVVVGLNYGYGLTHIPKVLVFAFFLTVAYVVFDKVVKLKAITSDLAKNIFFKQKFLLELILLLFILIFIVFHFIYLGNVPVIDAFLSTDYYGIAFLRQDIFQNSNVLVNYISSMMLKGILPFSVFYFYICNKKYFWIVLPLAIFYSIALMQKSLIVNVVLPLIVFLLLNKKFIQVFLFALVSVLGVFVLVYTTNPSLREGWFGNKNSITPKKVENNGSLNDASSAIYERVLFTTGKVAGHWFERIPSKYPYAKGCAYHFMAPILGCDFNDYDFSRIIYKDVYQKETKIGLKGTATVANFVYDYANFGYLGLIYSGIILALFFVFLQKLFNNYVLVLSLNALFVLWLSSSAFHTLLFSGGWVITILLFFVFKNYINQSFHVLVSKN